MKTVARKRPKTYNQWSFFSFIFKYIFFIFAAFSHALAKKGAAVKEGRWAWQQGRGTGVRNDPIAGEKFRL